MFPFAFHDQPHTAAGENPLQVCKVGSGPGQQVPLASDVRLAALNLRDQFRGPGHLSHYVPASRCCCTSRPNRSAALDASGSSSVTNSICTPAGSPFT